MRNGFTGKSLYGITNPRIAFARPHPEPAPDQLPGYQPSESTCERSLAVRAYRRATHPLRHTDPPWSPAVAQTTMVRRTVLALLFVSVPSCRSENQIARPLPRHCHTDSTPTTGPTNTAVCLRKDWRAWTVSNHQPLVCKPGQGHRPRFTRCHTPSWHTRGAIKIAPTRCRHRFALAMYVPSFDGK